jgi:hypothetical protein
MYLELPASGFSGPLTCSSQVCDCPRVLAAESTGALDGVGTRRRPRVGSTAEGMVLEELEI